MRNWLLPENIADILPATARQVESAKAAMLERFRTYGYELVCPPLIEYIDSLVYDGDTALVMKTFKLDDQMAPSAVVASMAIKVSGRLGR